MINSVSYDSAFDMFVVLMELEETEKTTEICRGRRKARTKQEIEESVNIFVVYL